MNNPFDTQFFDKAVAFATQAHSGTERRGKAYPYIIHPMEAVTIVATITNDPEMLVAALLHDTVEDTAVTIGQVREQFGDRVAALVQHETASLPDDAPWRTRKEAQVAQLANAPYDSKVVAMGDKLSNMRALAADYKALGDQLWKRFHAPNGKEDIAWYYRSLADALSELKGTAAYQEFVRLMEETF
ncbi:MAG: bifunctional (p)ppGpp synthetase/guanosine-3',5'-bis(diphosphate) 3'-pyrophosphohydrolase [Bacteroidales bacterium]|nr:bifunctional (p)ppGpp synthetase/guanosine-3',5'-bis(diphosphate) 3'-pyrophosphohydrolase [Bacteroidales bacterium]